ncbi:hydrogenase maturation nickel metallochaperone HypA [Frankia sp. R82]|uniref:hydrogenase maturation nickel metallochaperone HypA n=1 Tax=Frankia sp. R82 TaxID=2950553 RepID=UPI002043B242|nr:hydrogenase maturation nickel metallochaperone HypA [Frankia sp. R82]MCM3885766.1 hydrogenase maturation nickel metallochaperone HypA [Frankia sp. R82]
MHELSICRSVADIVARHAAGRQVTVVRLRVGALRQVVPATLVACWDLAFAGHPDGALLAGSVLEIDQVPARVSCRACGVQGALARPFVRCTACGADAGWLTLTGGEEFLVTSFEVAPPAQPAVAPPAQPAAAAVAAPPVQAAPTALTAPTEPASGASVPSMPTPSEPAPHAPAEV